MKFLDVWHSARTARTQGGIPVIAQVSDMVRLRLARHALSPSEYFNHRLFRRELSFADKAEYVGGWARDRLYRIQDPEQRELANDKIASARVLMEAGLPVPKLLAHTDRNQEVAGAVRLGTEAELAVWLREAAPYPLFAKPSISYLGYGAFLIDSFDRAGDKLVFRQGEPMYVNEFVNRYGRSMKRGGMMFQELMRPHASLKHFIGNRLGTARTVVLNGDDGPTLFACGYRIPVGTSMTDNFRYGTAGNMLARIDIATGDVRDVVADTGLNYRTASRHPDVGVSFDGMKMPNWGDAVAIALAGAQIFAGLKLQGWDLAFTDEGPKLVEVNSTGAVQLLQMCLGRGLAQPQVVDLYQKHGARI